MYTVAVSRELIAEHFLTGGDWGRENQIHSHRYRIELQLEGSSLNPHGFLVDIVDIEMELDRVVAHYHDQVLNNQAEFAGLNPSVEHFCRILCESLSAAIQASEVQALTVRVWESQIAWAAYRMER
jgi:6-pyruvoyltetrahydropterin/6-carboxytetrahydropterin synthase